MSTPITNRSGSVIGYNRVTGDKHEVTDRSGKLLGWYNQRTDTTVDRSGSVVGRGNLTAMLLARELV